MKNRFNWKRRALLLICILTTTFTALSQRRECPLAGYDGNWAFGTTTTFEVGDPFDGIGQIEVRRPGKQAQIHEKNRKWTINGERIKPGEVFTKVGKFIMTIESNGHKTAYNVEIKPSTKAPRHTAKVISYPSQTEYKVGNRFYIDGIKVESSDANGKKRPVEPKDITFFTSVSNTLVGAGSQCGGGYQFSTPGKKVIEVRYKHTTIGKYTINVVGEKKPSSTSPNMPSPSSKPEVLNNGWYHLRAMNNYLNIDKTGGGELRKRSINDKFYIERKSNQQITLRTANGNYLGIDATIKNGVRIKTVNTPYLWNIYSENNNDIYSLRPSSNTKMIMNASGEKNVDGTHIILWSYPDLNAPNNAEFRFIPTK